LELGGKGMSKKIILCTFFIGFQGIVENELEVGGQRGGCSMSVGHDSKVSGVLEHR
jgi:hypothetical protein